MANRRPAPRRGQQLPVDHRLSGALQRSVARLDVGDRIVIHNKRCIPIIAKVTAVRHDADMVVIDLTRGKPMRLPRASRVEGGMDRPATIA